VTTTWTQLPSTAPCDFLRALYCFSATTPAACTDDADCDDGVFCNGVETCVEGECQDGTSPCAVGENCIEDPGECRPSTLVLIFDDPDTEGIDYQIADGQTGELGEVRDSAPEAGVIQFNIDERPDGLFALASAVSKPLIPETGEGPLGPLGTDLILNVSALRYPGSLEISLTDTDYDYPSPTTGVASITGGIIGGSRIDFFFFGDTANQPFGEGFEIFSTGFDFPEPEIDVPDAQGPADPVGSLTLSAVIQEGEEENFDANASFVMILELVEGGCDVNADCDNDLFCDGLETCEEGVCQDGTPPCMTGETCDEENDECIGGGGGCSVDADCADDLFCNGMETCIAGECRDPLLNGSLDAWTGTELDNWSRGTAAGTVVEETVEVHTPGGSAAKLTRDAASGVLNVTQDLTGLEPSRWYRVSWWFTQDLTGLEPSRWYRVSWWWRTSANVNSPETRLRIQNVTATVPRDGGCVHDVDRIHGVVQDRRHPPEDRHVPGAPGRVQQRWGRLHHRPIRGRRDRRPRRAMHGRGSLQRRDRRMRQRRRVQRRCRLRRRPVL
jgi:hypothetical protein